MVTAFQEIDGSGSMRRTLAFLYSIICFEQLNLAVFFHSEYALLGACLCAVMVLLLMGMTTAEGIAGMIKAVRGKE